MKNKTFIAGFILITLTLFAVFLATAQSSLAEPSSVATANQLYENGRFAESAQLYEQLIAQEMASSAIHYNLGNAYYQQGDLGKAILNYNRALALDPRDADIKANLALARAQVVDQFGIEVEDDIFAIYTTAVSNNLTLNQTAVLALIFWFVFATAVIAVRQMEAGKLRNYLKVGTAVAGVLFFIATFSLGSRLYEQANTEPAVIVAPEVNITSGPGDQYATQFTLHSGAEVELLGERANWAKLALPGGETTGWLPAEAIEAIN